MIGTLIAIGWIISGLIGADGICRKEEFIDYIDWLFIFIIFTLGGYVGLGVYLAIELTEKLEKKFGIPKRYQ